ncbi:IS3 family transposase [Leuconostoc gasicomitatum]|uniref:IS3 family transposase n=3 Tax=Leuconostoc TaxID=1243 RepID=UPI001CC33CC3|nr:IS3 family transposase [Leuconostoc gasicomitatum]
MAEVFGPSKDSIALWVKQLEKRLAIVGGRKQNFKAIGHLTSQKIVRNVGLPLVNQFLAQGYALVRILSALKIKPSTYYNWRHWQPSRQEKRRESLKPYILDVWKTFKFYGYRRIAAYSQQTDGPKVSEYMTLKLMRELGNKSRMQKRYRKPKTLVTVDQKSNLLTPEQVNPPKFYYTLTFTDYFNVVKLTSACPTRVAFCMTCSR